MGNRIKNTKLNLISGLIKQFSSIVLPFVLRTVVIYVLGMQYQGLSGLFTSILQVLNLSELGFSTAVVFVLYKEIAANNIEKICAITRFLKKVYLIIGVVILILGLAIMPFLRFLTREDIPLDINIYILFSIYLINTSISYFLYAYKSVVLIAMQRSDVTNNVYTVCTTIVRCVQIVSLLLFKNYYVMIAFLPIGTLVNNLLINKYSRRYYPEITPKGIIDNETKKTLTKQIQGAFICKLGDIARNSFDNIVLSALLGLTIVAVYDNYYYIYSAVYGVMLVITHAIQASVGNSVATETVEKNYKDLLKFNFIFMWIVGWCTVSMFCLYQPFMKVWMCNDDTLLLSFLNMTLFSLYFYVINMNNMRNMYINANGLYWENRLWFIMEAVGNLVLNILLGILWGVTGIIVATIITIIVFNFITRNNVLFKSYFKISQKQFYMHHLLYFLITIVNCIICWWVCFFIPINGIAGIAIKLVVCLFLPNIIYFIIYFKYPLFKDAVVFTRRVFKRIRKNENESKS